MDVLQACRFSRGCELLTPEIPYLNISVAEPTLFEGFRHGSKNEPPPFEVLSGVHYKLQCLSQI